MKCSLCCGTILRCMMNVGLGLEARMCLSDQTCRAKQTHTGLLLVKQTFQLFTWFTALSVLFLVRRKYDGGFFFKFFQKVFPRNSVLPIPDIPTLSGRRPNWGIKNPIISILLFYLNSCVLFQLLFTPATGYRFKSLSDAPAHTIMEQVELLFNKEMRMRLA